MTIMSSLAEIPVPVTLFDRRVQDAEEARLNAQRAYHEIKDQLVRAREALQVELERIKAEYSQSLAGEMADLDGRFQRELDDARTALEADYDKRKAAARSRLAKTAQTESQRVSLTADLDRIEALMAEQEAEYWRLDAEFEEARASRAKVFDYEDEVKPNEQVPVRSSGPPVATPERPNQSFMVAVGVLVVTMMALFAAYIGRQHSGNPKLGSPTAVAAVSQTAAPRPSTTTTLPSWEQWPKNPILEKWVPLARRVAIDSRITSSRGTNLFDQADSHGGEWRLLMAAITMSCGGNQNCPAGMDNGVWGGLVQMQVSPQLIQLASSELGVAFNLNDPKTDLLIWARYMDDTAEGLTQQLKGQPAATFTQNFEKQLLAAWTLPRLNVNGQKEDFWTANNHQNVTDFWSLYTGWNSLTTEQFAAIESRNQGRIAGFLTAVHQTQGG